VAKIDIGEHLDATSEISLEIVKTRALRGVVVLTGRTFLLSTLSLIATGFLTVFLDPSEFGVYWIVSAVVNFLAYFSDVGLAAALIQKREKVNEEDLRTTFTVQQVLVFLLLILLFLATPYLANIYSLSSQGILLLYALGASFFMSSLKTIPSVLLERELEFGKLVLPQLLENLVYNAVSVVLAWKGFGLMSFTYALILRGLVGLFSIYILKPWRPAFAFSKKPLKKLLKFGVPYQMNSLLATLKDDGMTAVLGSILGTSGIGLLGWAQKWAQAPLRFFMDHVIKVTFPAFSRLQDDKKVLEASVTRSIFFICFLVFPTLIGLLVLAPILVEIIPRYDKWKPALIPLALIGINTIFAAVSTQLTNLLNSLGRVKTTFKLMVMWTILTWLFVPLLAIKYGLNGAALGYSLVGVSSVIAIYVTRKIVKFSLSESVVRPIIATIIMFLVLFGVKQSLSNSLTSVTILIFLGIVTYFFSIYLLIGTQLIKDAKTFFSTLLAR